MQESVQEKFDVSQDWIHQEGKLGRELAVHGETYTSWVPMDARSDDHLGDWWRAYLNGVSPTKPDIESRRPVRVAELFCGPGGLAQGARQACLELGYEFESAVAVDQDAQALSVYELNHGTQYLSDTEATMLVQYKIQRTKEAVKFRYPPEITDDRLGQHINGTDLLLAGPPCQGHSNLNNKTRRYDYRNELYLVVPSLAIAADIPLVVIENVTAVVHDKSGHDVTATTAKLFDAAGYAVEMGVLKANKLGWPQTRSRHFLVARHERLGGGPIPLMDVMEALASETRDVMWAIGDLVGKDGDSNAGMDRVPDMNSDNQKRIKWFKDHPEDHDLPIKERPPSHQNEDTYTERKSVYGRMYSDRPSPTLTTGFGTPGRGRYVHPTELRVLTPREAARIQGFPDTYRWQIPGEPVPKAQSLAKWIGDAVPMPLGHAATLSALGPGLPN